MIRKNKGKLITIGVLLVLLIILLIFRSTSSMSDFFALNISSFLVKIIGSFSNFIPFSLFEIVLIIIASIALFLLIKLIIYSIKRNKDKIFKYFIFISLFSLILIDSFISVCGVCYQRSEIELPFYEGEVTTNLIDDTIDYYLKDYNQLSLSFEKDEKSVSKCPYSFKDLAKIMMDECDRLDQFNYYYDFTARPKATWLSFILNELQITGIDFPFTAEANINYQMPSIDIPFTMAHEIAHLKGVMREDDANTVALYICITSDIPYVRYSGYFRGFSRLLEIKAFTNRKEYLELLPKISSQISKDNNDYYSFFEEHDLLDDISTFFNDLYLSLNGEKDGTDSYDDVSQSRPTGEVDKNGYEIREYTSYSPYQKLLIQNYINRIEGK